jgi:hypothetical protein
MPTTNNIDKRLQISGTLLIAGLLIEALCLLSSRPIAFVVFVAFGGFLMVVGISLYLYSLVSATGSGE